MSFVSNSSSFIPDYQEEPFLNQLAQIASQLGQQQYSWAQQQFANTSALTDQAVNNFLDASQSAKSLADNNLSRYTGVFQPEEDQLVADANSYTSQPRVAYEMGKAESHAGQAMDANRINAERELQSFGVDPSSGRYAELEMAQNAQRGAAQAGAAQQAQYNTENTGRQLRGQAIQVGQQYPGQIVNALNARDQSLSGAVNSKLANLNSGVAALSSADPFLNTASSLKYPPLGNSSHSQSGQGFKVNSGNNSRSGGSSGGPGGSGTAGYPGNINSPVRGSVGITGQPTALGGYSGPSITNVDPNSYSNGSGFDNGNIYTGGTTDPFASTYGGYNDPSAPGSGYNDYFGTDPASYSDPSYTSDPTAGFSNYDSAAPSGWSDPAGSYTGWDNSGGFDNSGSSYNTGGQDFGGYSDPSFSGGSDPSSYSSYDSGGGFDSGSSDFAAGGAVGGGAARFGNFFGSTPAGTLNMSASGDNGQMSANGGGYEAGVASPMAMAGVSSQPFTGTYGGGQRPISLAAGGDPTTGGQVSQDMSPSGGQLQDDVPANLNEGEFVVPRDVAMWKGQEFFQKMIDQARKARMGASAQGKPGPRQPGPPRFVSQSMGAR